jgi:hypothetical protein
MSVFVKPLLLGGILPVFLSTCVHATSSTSADEQDFAIQGEFLGKVETVSPVLGVQVVSNGGGRFTAAFLIGGLPGAGWDGINRIEQSGTLQGSSVTFIPADTAKGYTATILADGLTLSGKTPKGELFNLNKIFRTGPTLGASPPPGAIVLFNGTDLSAFVAGTAVLDSGLLLPTGSASTGALTKKTFGSFTLHLEFLEPFMPSSSGQARGNSGVYLQGRYELQILDSFGLNIYRGQPGGETQECGAFYQLVAPKQNMSLPPLTWQTYDVDFIKAKYDSQGKTQLEPAKVTVRLNGVVIHENQPLINNTLLGDPVASSDGPIRFQAHGDPVKYRNIWLVEGSGSAIRPNLHGKQTLKNGALAAGRSAGTLTLLTGRKCPGFRSSAMYLLADHRGPVAFLHE